MNFSIEKKGYSIEEVDSFIEDILGKYQKLQAQNTELEQKLATAKRLIRRFSDTENALKQNIADSKRAAAYMISDAKDRSADLLDNARESCGEIISDLDLQIAQKMETVSLMKAEVAAFREQLFSLYSSHIEMIDTLASTAEDFEYVPDYTAVADAVDEFEAAGEPDCTVPEFVEYPEESIFSDIKEEEEPVVSEGFTLEEEEAEFEQEEITFNTDEAVNEAVNEDEDLDQLILGALSASEEAAAFEFEEAAEPALENEAELEFESPEDEIAFEEMAEAEVDEEIPVDDDTDYFKFLTDFVNSDDELDS